MIRLRAALLGLALLATPAAGWAKESPKAKQLLKHFASLGSEGAETCGNFDKFDPATRQRACEEALARIEDARRAHRNPSVGETANYDYWQVTLQAALAVAYAEQDGGIALRSCELLVSNDAIRTRLRAIPENQLSAVAYQTFQNPPENMADLVNGCRRRFPDLR